IQYNHFKQYNLSTLNRNRIVVLSREILRWKGRLDLLIKKYIDHPIDRLQSQLLVILELATYELIIDDNVPDYAAINSAVDLAKRKFNKKTGGLVNAVLRKISSDATNIKPEGSKDFEWYSFPNWLFEKWLLQFGESRTHQLCEYFNSTVPLTIRRNDTKIDHDSFIEKIESDDIKLSQNKNSDRFYDVDSGGSQLINNPLFHDGYFSFQDRGAGAIVEVLDPRPNDIILDVCCAPGTKTNYIAELMQNSGKIFACDIDKERIDVAKKDDVRFKNINIIWEQKDATKDTFPMADRVLVDAPCTGTGVIGRRPDIKWRRKHKHLERIVELQKSILNNVQKFVKLGGVLVYATCSLEEEENWQVVEAFLKLHNNFRVASIKNTQLVNIIDEKSILKTFPPEDKMDGMFAVKMIRER
ncbi:16S rRNA (cytosine(967)-C(5))-methyltransferase RsmB, partial [Candidatus Neomarinimicrobiota bacterium]